MPGRFSSVRRAALLVAFLVSVAAFASSLAGIAGAGSDLHSAVSATRSVERSAPVVHRQAETDEAETDEDCPARAEADRVEL